MSFSIVHEVCSTNDCTSKNADRKNCIGEMWHEYSMSWIRWHDSVPLFDRIPKFKDPTKQSYIQKMGAEIAKEETSTNHSSQRRNRTQENTCVEEISMRIFYSIQHHWSFWLTTKQLIANHFCFGLFGVKSPKRNTTTQPVQCRNTGSNC